MLVARRREIDLTDRRSFLLLVLTVALLFWAGDALLMDLIWGEPRLVQRLFFPAADEALHLVLVAFLVYALLWYGRRVVRGRDALEQALEQALLEAQGERQKVEAIMEAMGDGVSIVAGDFTVLYQNRAHQELLGEHAGKPCYSAYRGQEEVCPDCILKDSFQDGAVHMTGRRLELDGTTRHTEITASALRDADGRVVAGIQLVRDVSERKLAEAALERQAALLEKLIETIPIPIYYQDPTGRFLGCNAAYAAFLGLARETLLESTLAEVAPQHDLEEAARDRELMESLGTRVYEATIPGPGGVPRQVILSKGAFTDGSGACAGVVGAIVDISGRKEAEAQIMALNRELKVQAADLAAANRDLEAFSYSASHDLRTPLTRIYGAAQALLECGCNLDDNGVYFVKAINDGCRDMQELIDALLVLCRVNRAELEVGTVDLTEIVWEIALKLRQGDPGRHARFHIAEGLTAAGDAALLRVALENLVENAWKYTGTEKESVIEFGARSGEGGETVYFLRDNGAGFDMARAAGLFEPFQRLHPSSQFPGTGVGLATVQRIVQRHRGRVWGEGAVGRGATFSFTLGEVSGAAETVAGGDSFML